jgi:peptide/nickel transport system substrate-binding protein
MPRWHISLPRPTRDGSSKSSRNPLRNVVENIATHLQSLPPSDRVIAYVLLGIIAILGVSSLYALERTFLVEVPARGGSLTEGIIGSPRFVNPVLAISDTDKDLVALTFAGLMGHDGAGALIPVIAQEYELSEDGKVYTFTLRENVTFSDGTPITADDVVFTVEKVQDPELKSPSYANWANIHAESIDARTVRFTLPKAYAPFLEDATLGILPAHLWRDVRNEEFAFSPLMHEPVGAGPFKVTSFSRGKNGIISSYTLQAFNGFALSRPYLDSITIKLYKDEDELLDALRKHQIESAYGTPDPNALRVPYARVFGIFFNSNENKALESLAVRKALSLALDRDAIVNDILGGYATPIMGPVPPGSGVALTEVPAISGDIEGASALLTDAGWVYDEEARVWKNDKEKRELRLTLRTANVPELKLVAQKAQEDFARLGVPTALEVFEPSALTQEVIRPRKYEALLFGMVVGQERDLYAFWHSGERSDPGLNIALYSNKSVDALLEKVRSVSNVDERLEGLATIEREIGGDYPAVFTHAPEFTYTLPDDLRGVALTQIASPSDRFMDVHSWYRKSEAVWPWFKKSP